MHETCDATLAGPRLRDYEFTLLRDFLSEHFGIYYGDDKKWLLEMRFQALVERGRYVSFFDYFQHLMHKFFSRQAYEDPEFVELVGKVTNNDSYFFRECGALTMLGDSLRRFREAENGRSVRILSAACSSGEEPYSIAMRLLRQSNGRPDPYTEIVGCDVDAIALERARGGCYREHSFRGVSEAGDLEAVARYFQRIDHPHGSIFEIDPRVKDMVRFEQANLLDPEHLRTLGSFDVVFCRNVLMYFSEEAKQKTMKHLHAIMRPQGMLLLGHSDTLGGLGDYFRPLETRDMVCYERC